MIGLLDSGVGGLTVAAELMKLMPDQRFIYYGDTLHLPYGPRPLEEVQDFSIKIIEFLISEKNADLIAIACNTASSSVLEKARRYFDIPIYGTIDPAVFKAISLTNNKKIGVIGTKGTINSKAYQSALKRFDSELEIYDMACPLFVDFVEGGQLAGPKVKEYANRSLLSLKKAGVDTLILGCTHFPYLLPVIKEVMGRNVDLVDPGVEMAVSIKNNIDYNPNTRGGVLNKEESGINKDNKKDTLDFIVSDRNNISNLLWRNDLLGDRSISVTEINVFNKEEDNV